MESKNKNNKKQDMTCHDAALHCGLLRRLSTGEIGFSASSKMNFSFMMDC